MGEGEGWSPTPTFPGIWQQRYAFDRARRVLPWYIVFSLWYNLWGNPGTMYRKCLIFYSLFFKVFLDFVHEEIIIIIIIIIVTSHRLITRWDRLRLLLGSTCSQFLSSFSFYRRRYLHPFPSNILTGDVFSTVRMSHSRQLSR